MRRNFFSVFATVQAEVINILVLHGQFDPVIINNMTSVNNYSNRELQQITKDNMDRELSYQILHTFLNPSLGPKRWKIFNCPNSQKRENLKCNTCQKFVCKRHYVDQ